MKKKSIKKKNTLNSIIYKSFTHTLKKTKYNITK